MLFEFAAGSDWGGLKLVGELIAVQFVSSATNDRLVSPCESHSSGLRTGGPTVSSGDVSYRSCNQSTTSQLAGRDNASSSTHCSARAISESGESDGSMVLMTSLSRRNLTNARKHG